MNVTMTKSERADLSKLVRQRAKVARAQAAQRKAELLADFEKKLAAIYTPNDDATFRRLYDDTNKVVEEAKVKLAERCRVLGIPRQFAPGLSLSWYGRGENALNARRAELRKVAVSRLDAMEKAACTEIERVSVEVQTQLVADGLNSEAARRFLAEMPTVEKLMQPLEMKGMINAGSLQEEEHDDKDEDGGDDEVETVE